MLLTQNSHTGVNYIVIIGARPSTMTPVLDSNGNVVVGKLN